MSTPYQLQQAKPLMNILLYGDQGVGKTVFAATAMDHPDLSEVLFCNVEGGLMSVSNRKPMVVDIGLTEEGQNNGRAFMDLDAVAEAIATKKPGFEKVRTVVIDSGTEFQQKDLETIVAASRKKNPTRDDAPGLDDFGKSTTRMRRMFRIFRDIKVNVIITALVKREEKVRESGKVEVLEQRPAFTRGVGESVMGFVDFVWYMGTSDEGVRYLVTQPTAVTRAKTRSPAFAEAIGKVVKNPNLPDLYNKLCECLAKDEVKK